MPDLEAETELKETCMYHASQNGHFHVVEYLLELEAARGLTMVGSLINSSTTIDHPPGGYFFRKFMTCCCSWTPQRQAVALTSLLRYTLQICTDFGWSCAYVAAANGRVRTLKALLGCNAEGQLQVLMPPSRPIPTIFADVRPFVTLVFGGGDTLS